MSIMSAWPTHGGPTVRSTHRGQLREISSSGEQELFAPLEGIIYADSWTSDGNTLIVTQKIGTRSSLLTFTRGDTAPKPLFDDKRNARFGQVSPDDKWLAYVANVQKVPEIWVRGFSPLTEPVRVSLKGGGAPVWAKDGSELFYRRPNGRMVAATFATGPDLVVKTRTPLFINDYDADPAGHQHYDVTADGRRFLMIKNEYFAPDHIHVVTNALAEPER